MRFSDLSNFFLNMYQTYFTLKCGKKFYQFSTPITANVTETTADEGSFAVTSHDTGKRKIFVSDGSKWQEFAVLEITPGTHVAFTPVNSKAGYVYYQNITAASTSAGADQLDLNGVAEPEVMANIVQPDVPRNVVINFTDGDVSIDAFSVTVAGKAPDGNSITETFLFAGGLDQVGSKIFAKVDSVTLNSINGNGAGDTLDLGYGAKIGVPLPFGSTGMSIVKLVSNGAEEAASATDTTNNSFTPTTAPDGSKDFEIWYEYSDPAITALNDAVAGIISSLEGNTVLASE